MKKMKAEEFKEALNKAGFDMDVYGYEGILNILVGKLYDEAYELEHNHNTHRYAKFTRKKADVLYDILEARGYYND